MVGLTALVVAIVVGLIAQTWKRRSAASWGMTAFLAVLVVWWFLDQLVGVNEPALRANPSGQKAILIMAVIVGGIAVLTIIVMVPARPKLPEVLHEDRVPCPICAEPIMRAALKCRFCGADLAPVEARSKALEGRFDRS